MIACRPELSIKVSSVKSSVTEPCAGKSVESRFECRRCREVQFADQPKSFERALERNKGE